MSPPENFLKRWSRRKAQAEQPVAPKRAATAEASERTEPTRGAAEFIPTASKNDSSSRHPEVAAFSRPSKGDGPVTGRILRGSPGGLAPQDDGSLTNAVSPAAGAKPTAFDPSSLPSLESIGADSDIRAFLAPAVPAELSRAALRRAWAADPAIREFVGLAENAWDFNVPGALHGFDTLKPTEIAELAKQFLQSQQSLVEAEPQPPAKDCPAETIAQIEKAVPDNSSADAESDSAGREPAVHAELIPEGSLLPGDVPTTTVPKKSADLANDVRRRVRGHGHALPE